MLVSRNMMAFIHTVIREHQGNRGNDGEDEAEEDLVDVLLMVQKEDQLGPPLTTENIKAMIIVRLHFGTDATRREKLRIGADIISSNFMIIILVNRIFLRQPANRQVLGFDQRLSFWSR